MFDMSRTQALWATVHPHIMKVLYCNNIQVCRYCHFGMALCSATISFRTADRFCHKYNRPLCTFSAYMYIIASTVILTMTSSLTSVTGVNGYKC